MTRFPSKPCASFPIASVGHRALPLLAFVGSVFAANPGIAVVPYPEGATTIHFSFNGSPRPDYPIIRPPAPYHADDGFGFVESPGLIGTARGVMAPRYFRFDTRMPAGVYEVTLVFGGTPGESLVHVRAEGQPVVQELRIARGETATKAFTVTVKPGTNAVAPLDGDGRLTLEFTGTNPSLMKLNIQPAP